MNPDELKKKVEESLGLSRFPEAVRNEFISLLAENCLKRATLALNERLAPGERAEHEKIAATGDYQKAHEYLASRVPNFGDVVEKEIADEIAEFKKKSGL